MTENYKAILLADEKLADNCVNGEDFGHSCIDRAEIDCAICRHRKGRKVVEPDV